MPRVRRGPYTTRLTMPRGMSYSSGIASGRACARYGLGFVFGFGAALFGGVGLNVDGGVEKLGSGSGLGRGCDPQIEFCGGGGVEEANRDWVRAWAPSDLELGPGAGGASSG